MKTIYIQIEKALYINRDSTFGKTNPDLKDPAFRSPLLQYPLSHRCLLRPLHGDWCVFCLLIHCIIGSYFVYLSIKNSIIFLPWHTNPRIPMSM
ncbi:hypothetical protein PGF_00016070 [Porphyromonas gingivalis 381]|nr:hypothetical protein PGF_00016070 [Porphyromonas gingivalis 381]